MDNLLPLPVAQLALLWLAAIVAALIRSFTGFGFALAAVPGFALFMPPAQAVVLSASLGVGIGIQTFPRYARDANIKGHWLLYASAVVGTLVGVQVLRAVDENLFKILIGTLTVVAGVALAGWRPQPRKRGGMTESAAGLCSGLINGAFAIPGPPVIIYVLASEADPRRSRSVMVAFFTFSGLVALSLFAFSGLVTWKSALLALWVYPGILLGDRIGVTLFARYASAHHRRVAIVVLLVLGLSIALKGLLD